MLAGVCTWDDHGMMKLQPASGSGAEDILKQMSALLKVREVLVALAELHTGTIMPGFTHLQHAQPTTLLTISLHMNRHFP